MIAHLARLVPVVAVLALSMAGAGMAGPVRHAPGYVLPVVDNVKHVANGSATVVLAFVATPVPRFEGMWNQVAAFYKNRTDVIIAAINSARYRHVAQQYGVRDFPSILVFPKGLPAAPFEIPYHLDLTVHEMIGRVEDFLGNCNGLVPTASDVYRDVGQLVFSNVENATAATLEQAQVRIHMERRALKQLMSTLDILESMVQAAQNSSVAVLVRERNELVNSLVQAPKFMTPDARRVLLHRYHVLQQILSEDLLAPPNREIKDPSLLEATDKSKDPQQAAGTDNSETPAASATTKTNEL